MLTAWHMPGTTETELTYSTEYSSSVTCDCAIWWFNKGEKKMDALVSQHISHIA